MSARRLMALVKSHIDGDTQQFYSTALQAAAEEARQGHARIAKELRDLIDKGRSQQSLVQLLPTTTAIAQPRGDLAALLTADYPTVRLSSMVLSDELRTRIERILHEQINTEKLRSHNLAPRRKLLLIGPPGTGKTMTAAVAAAELKLPLLTIRLEGIITKFLGETAQKLLSVFEAMSATKGVYLFDEFDALGSKRTSGNDVGEIRRVLNSFLQMLENDRSQSLVICATNHPELLDRALFRRFDDALEFGLPQPAATKQLLEARLSAFDTLQIDWDRVVSASAGLSQAELVRASDEAAKTAVLADQRGITTETLVTSLQERLTSPR